jgi:hypothetical protein
MEKSLETNTYYLIELLHMYIPFDQISPESRIWVYQADRRFSKAELELIYKELKEFCENWNTHGALMPTSFTVKFDQVIVLAVDERQLGASGCSIDSSVRTLKALEQKFQINILDQGKISFFPQENVMEVSSLFELKDKVMQGVLTSETAVLNPVVSRKSDLENSWMIPAKESWLNKYFKN